MYDENSSTQLMALANLMNVKDSRWLQLEICREFQRGQCSRTELECKFSHPPPHVEIQNGRVTACYDSIKGRCTRENPKCKYLHPPQHLKDQLLVNGKNNLAMKNLFMNHLTTQATVAPIGVSQLAMTGTGALFPDVQAAAYSPYAAYAAYTLNPATAVYPGIVASPDVLNSIGTILQTNGAASTASIAAAMAMQAQKSVASQIVPNRQDRVEVCRDFLRGTCANTADDCRSGAHPPPHIVVASGEPPAVTLCMNFALRGAGGCSRPACRYFHMPPHLLPSSGGTSDVTRTATASPSVRVPSTPSLQQQQMLNAAYYVAAVQAAAAARNLAVTSSSSTMFAAATQTANVSVGKKRPLELDNSDQLAAVGIQSLTDSYQLLAAAALNSTANKRAALDKNGFPFYQQFTGLPTVSLGYQQYPQYAAIPTLQAPYLPYFTFAGHPPGLPRL